MGRSIGTGAACHLASKRPIGKLILVSPFDSIRTVAGSIVPYLGYIVRNHFNNMEALDQYNGELLIIHGKKD